jgi:hypothetical protein
VVCAGLDTVLRCLLYRHEVPSKEWILFNHQLGPLARVSLVFFFVAVPVVVEIWGYYGFLVCRDGLYFFLGWHRCWMVLLDRHVGSCVQYIWFSTNSLPKAFCRACSKSCLLGTNDPFSGVISLHDDLKVPFIKDVIQEKSINHHDKLGNHSNLILQPLLEQQQRRRLKKLWPADLIDGWRGFTHWRGPHQDTISTGGRCLTQHKA